MKIFSGAKSVLSVTALIGFVFVTGCSSDDFHIKGELDGADRELVVLEKADFGGRWIPLDSVRTDGSGFFTISGPAPGAPEIYRLKIGNGYAYVPIDSTETVTLRADTKDFVSSWSLGGSENAAALSDFEKDLRARLPYLSVPDSARAFKRHVYSEYIRDANGSVVTYYIMTRVLDDNKPLFDPYDSEDLKIFSAVATAYREFKPEDPRTALLENTVITARRAANSNAGRKLVVEAEETGLLPVCLPDEEGREVSLSSIAGKGKPVILMFGVIADSKTVAANHIIADLISRRGGDLAVYSVSFDSDAGFWRESARNVPWTTVLDHNATSSVGNDYNISDLPCFFIIDRSGNLVDRTTDSSELESLLRKH